MWLILLVVLALILAFLPTPPVARMGARSDGRLAPISEKQSQDYRESYGGLGELAKFLTEIHAWGQPLWMRMFSYWQRD